MDILGEREGKRECVPVKTGPERMRVERKFHECVAQTSIFEAMKRQVIPMA